MVRMKHLAQEGPQRDERGEHALAKLDAFFDQERLDTLGRQHVRER